MKSIFEQNGGTYTKVGLYLHFNMLCKISMYFYLINIADTTAKIVLINVPSR